MSSICLCLQNMPNKENIWYAVAYILYVCVFVKVCPSLSVFQIQPAVCWWLSCVDDTSCWQWAWGEDASHNITAGRWEDITSKRTHTYTVTNYDTVLKSYQGPYLDWLSSLTSLSILISWTRQPLQAWSCHGPTHKMSHCFISGTVTNAHSLQVPSCSWTSCCAIIDCFIGIHLVLLMSLLLIWNLLQITNQHLIAENQFISTCWWAGFCGKSRVGFQTDNSERNTTPGLTSVVTGGKDRGAVWLERTALHYEVWHYSSADTRGRTGFKSGPESYFSLVTF